MVGIQRGGNRSCVVLHVLLRDDFEFYVAHTECYPA